MKKEWLIEAAVIAGVSAPMYFAIQVFAGSEAGKAATRAAFFLVVVGIAALLTAAGRDRRAQRREPPPESGP